MGPGEPLGCYAPPGPTGQRPRVIVAFRIYAASILLAFVAVVTAWEWLIPSGQASRAPTAEGSTVASVASVALWLLLVVGVTLLHGVAACVPYRPWGWVLGLVTIGIGLSSCMIPLAVPLLVFWLKPETKAAFGRL